MSDSEKQKLSVFLGDGVGEYQFDSLEDIATWIREERIYWKWLSEVRHNVPIVFNLWSQAENLLQSILGFINKYENASGDERAAFLEEISKQFKHIYKEPLLLASQTPKADFVTRLSQKNRDQAAWALLYFLNPANFPPKTPGSYEGAFHAIAFLYSVPEDKANSEKKELEKATKEWSHLREKVKSYLDEFQEKSNQLEEARTTQFNQQLHEQKEKYEGLVSVYLEQMGLRAPVDYWTKKAETHHARASYFAIALGLSALGFILVLGFEIWYLDIFNYSDSQIPPYWKLSLLVGSAAFLIWPLRILAKLLFSNLHLKDDSQERVTMVTTFLALMEKDKGSLSSGDRHLILEALYRPGSTGIIKEEGISQSTLLSYLSRLISGKST